MAIGLPYFKFDTTEWMTGTITLHNYETQGIFINLCGLYWSRLGDMSYRQACRKFGKDQIDLLISDNIIKTNDDLIAISFLDEQMDERKVRRQINTENGKLGGRPPNNPKKTNSVNSEKQTETETKGNRIEQNRIEQNRVKSKRFAPPSFEDVKNYIIEREYSEDVSSTEAQKFVDYYSSNGWKVGKNSMKDWKAAVRNWLTKVVKTNNGKPKIKPYNPMDELMGKS